MDMTFTCFVLDHLPSARLSFLLVAYVGDRVGSRIAAVNACDVRILGRAGASEVTSWSIEVASYRTGVIAYIGSES